MFLSFCMWHTATEGNLILNHAHVSYQSPRTGSSAPPPPAPTVSLSSPPGASDLRTGMAGGTGVEKGLRQIRLTFLTFIKSVEHMYVGAHEEESSWAPHRADVSKGLGNFRVLRLN